MQLIQEPKYVGYFSVFGYNNDGAPIVRVELINKPSAWVRFWYWFLFDWKWHNGRPL